MDIVARLVAFKDYTGLSNSQFADKAGIPRPTLSQLLNGRNKRLSDDMTAKLHVAYPSLNIMWLLFGEGSMLSDSNIQFSEAIFDENSPVSDAQTIDNPSITASDLSEFSNGFIQQSSENSSNSTENESQAADISRKLPSDNPIIEETVKNIPADAAKKIQSIMIFYSDNSYEIFTPGKL